MLLRIFLSLSVTVVLWNIALSQSTRPLAFRNVNVIDIQNGKSISDQTVVVQDGKIVLVGATKLVKIPADSKVVNASGKFMMPGLWDSHAHLSYVGACALPVLVANGVTSVRDLGSTITEVNKWRRMIREGSLVGPRIKVTGYNIESGKWLDAAMAFLQSSEELKKQDPFKMAPRLRVDTDEQAKEAVDSLIKMGSDVVKFRNLGGEFYALAKETKRRGIPLVGHAPKEITLAQASDAGMASIEHGETISNRLTDTDSITRVHQFMRLAQNGTMITPTLITDYRMKLSSSDAMKIAINDSLGAVDQRNKFISPFLRKVWRLGYYTKLEDHTDWKPFLHRSALDLQEANRQHVPMLVGTDLGVILIYPGSSVHEEMRLMVETIGMTPADVLRSAILNPAMFFNLQNVLGTIEPNKYADMVLLDANPLTDILNTQRINGVVSNGFYFDRATLNKIILDASNNLSHKTGCATEN